MITRKCVIQNDGWLPWTQPILSADGTLGGTSFAVSGKNYMDADTYHYYYLAVDGDDSTYWASGTIPGGWFEFYSPHPLKIESIRVISSSPNGNIKTGGIYGSNDGANWTQLLSITSYGGQDTTYTINAAASYKYFKLDCVSTNNFLVFFSISNLIITAKYQP